MGYLISTVKKLIHQLKTHKYVISAYIDNIQKKTGKSPDDFKKLAEEKGFLQNGDLTVKATQITNWLKEEFKLGNGHAMTIYASFKGKTE